MIIEGRLRTGLWFTDKDGNYIPYTGEIRPDGAVYAHSCFPLEVQEKIYRIRDDGGYGEKDRVLTSCTHLSRESGKLAVAMVNSGDFDLSDALAVLAQCCERCCNVLWNKYLPEEDGYEEFSEEWYKANTVCEFCKDSDNRRKTGNDQAD